MSLAAATGSQCWMRPRLSDLHEISLRLGQCVYQHDVERAVYVEINKCRP